MAQPFAASTAWFDRSSRIRLTITGPDRAKFLHNLTTNDVKRLPVGSGHEAFVTSPQGKTLAYVTLLATAEAILLRTDPGVADSFLPHLTKYGVFDDITLTDVAPATFEYHVVGPDAEALVVDLGRELSVGARALQHVEVHVDGHAVRLIREDLLGTPGWTWIGPLAGASAVRDRFAAANLVLGDEATFEARRILAGTPVSGRDVQTSNLPQEVGRDSRAINFVKGCYLGQETVARLDALGHVNRILRGGWLEGTTMTPPAGTPLVDEDGKPVGAITSAAYSAERGSAVFLAYIRVAQATDGTRLMVPSLTGDEGAAVVAVVAELPAG